MLLVSDFGGSQSIRTLLIACEALEDRRLFTAQASDAAPELSTIVASLVDDLLAPITVQLGKGKDDDDDRDDNDQDDDHDDDDGWRFRDLTAPTALIGVGGVSPNDPAVAITVHYADDRAIDFSTLDSNDLTVNSPDGKQHSVTLIDIEAERLGTEAVATYALSAPGGAWDAADNGDWTVQLAAGGVKDGWGNSVDPAASTFRVNVEPPPPPPPEALPPEALPPEVLPPVPPVPVEPDPVPAPSTVPATPVDEDFSGGTPVTSGFVAEAAVTLADGRILLAGRQGDFANGTSQGVLKRLNADGSADCTFGKSGIVTTPAGQNAGFFGAALNADGSVVVTGRIDRDVLVSRYKASGGLDKSFGVNGSSTVDWGSTDTAYAIAVGGEGQIVVGGGSNGAFGVSRLTAAGDIDSSFGTRGTALFSLDGGGDNTVGAIALQADGKVLAAGSVGGKVAVFRLSSSGQTDRTFGSGGAVVLNNLSSVTQAGTPDHTFGLAIQADRGILVANHAGGNFSVERLLFSGDRDRTFGQSGRASIDFSGDDDADAIVVQQSGDIVVVGTTTAQNGRLAVAALQPNGALNTAYADGGKLTLEAGVAGSGRALHAGSLVLRAFASARGNEVVVGGSGGVNTPSGTGLRRLNVPGMGLIGHFGIVDGKNKVLRFKDGDGSAITLSLTNGSGQAYYDGAKVELVLVDVTDRSQLKVVATGGDRRVSLGDAHVFGSIGIVNAKTADLAGTFWIAGSADKLTFGGVAGTLATTGSIGTLTIRDNAAAATVLAGADLGSDHLLGGKGGKADIFAAASIDTIHVRGSVTKSLFAAGLNRGNSKFLDKDDTIVGGTASRIGLIRIEGDIDAASRFVCGSLGKANLPIDIDPAEDERFVVL